MYVAIVKLKTKLGEVLPGQVVEDAMNWKYPIILAHVNLNRMKWVEDGKAPAQPKTPKAEKPKAIAPKETAPATTTPPAEKVACSVEGCGKEFKNERALKIHVTSKHSK